MILNHFHEQHHRREVSLEGRREQLRGAATSAWRGTPLSALAQPPRRKTRGLSLVNNYIRVCLEGARSQYDADISGCIDALQYPVPLQRDELVVFDDEQSTPCRVAITREGVVRI